MRYVRRFSMLVMVAVFLLILPTDTRSDEPPGWFEYQVTDIHNRYLAVIRADDTLTHLQGWDRSYRLTVFAIKPDSSKLTELWTTPYRWDGYPGGMLTDDGDIFVNINSWYYDSAAVVTIVQKDQPVKTIMGREFQIDPVHLINTVSHQLWICDTHPCRDYTYLDDYDKTLRIATIDNRSHRIDLTTGKITESYGGGTNRWPAPLTYAVVIGGLLFLNALLVYIVLSNRKKRRKRG